MPDACSSRPAARSPRPHRRRRPHFDFDIAVWPTITSPSIIETRRSLITDERAVFRRREHVVRATRRSHRDRCTRRTARRACRSRARTSRRRRGARRAWRHRARPSTVCLRVGSRRPRARCACRCERAEHGDADSIAVARVRVDHQRHVVHVAAGDPQRVDAARVRIARSRTAWYPRAALLRSPSRGASGRSSAVDGREVQVVVTSRESTQAARDTANNALSQVMRCGW